MGGDSLIFSKTSYYHECTYDGLLRGLKRTRVNAFDFNLTQKTKKIPSCRISFLLSKIGNGKWGPGRNLILIFNCLCLREMALRMTNKATEQFHRI